MGDLTTLLGERARSQPDGPALRFQGEEMSYSVLDAAVDRLAAHLRERGVQPGERVGIILPNTPTLPVALFAVWRLGAVTVPLNARLRAYEIERILRDADTCAVISAGSYRGYDLAAALHELLRRAGPFRGSERSSGDPLRMPAEDRSSPSLPSVRACLFLDAGGEIEGELPGHGREPEAEPLPPEIAAILYTSGTTGVPKGALVTHRREMLGAQAMAQVLALTPDDISLYVIPISHAFGLTCFLSAMASGGTAVLLDSTFSPEPMLDAIRREEVTILHGSPALFTSLLKAAPDGAPSLGGGFVAGASSPPDILARLDTTGARILNLFGMTEIGAAACARRDDPPEVRYTSVGRPLPGYELRTAEDGELEVRGPGVTPGYYRQPERTAEAFDGGWFRTGDLGSIDGAGVIRISGRAKEVVHVAGLSVFPAEVEGFLVTHPDITQAAVVGVPHESMGEALEAFIVPRSGAALTAPDVLRFARAHIAGYKLPYVIHIVPELPLLASGKPDRLALTQRATQGRTEQSGAGTGTGAHPTV